MDQFEVDQWELEQRELDQAAPGEDTAVVAALVEVGVDLKDFSFYN